MIDLGETRTTGLRLVARLQLHHRLAASQDRLGLEDRCSRTRYRRKSSSIDSLEVVVWEVVHSVGLPSPAFVRGWG